MNLPKKAVEEFRKIFQEKTGDQISYEVAEIEAINFLSLTDLLINGETNENN
jgi:hypothetical protein